MGQRGWPGPGCKKVTRETSRPVATGIQAGLNSCGRHIMAVSKPYPNPPSKPRQSPQATATPQSITASKAPQLQTTVHREAGASHAHPIGGEGRGQEEGSVAHSPQSSAIPLQAGNQVTKLSGGLVNPLFCWMQGRLRPCSSFS